MSSGGYTVHHFQPRLSVEVGFVNEAVPLGVRGRDQETVRRHHVSLLDTYHISYAHITTPTLLPSLLPQHIEQIAIALRVTDVLVIVLLGSAQ